MASNHRISAEELSRLPICQRLAFIEDYFPRYTPTELRRNTLAVYECLGQKAIRTAVQQGILREDYTVGWSNGALVKYVRTKYHGVPLKQLCADEPLLAEQLKERSLLPLLAEQKVIIKKRPAGFFRKLGAAGRAAHIQKHFSGCTLSELKELDQSLYYALTNKERAQLIESGVCVRGSMSRREQRHPYRQTKAGVKARKTQSEAPDDAEAYPTTSEAPKNYEAYAVPQEYIWQAMRAFSSEDSSPRGELSLDERLRWAQQQGMFGEV